MRKRCRSGTSSATTTTTIATKHKLNQDVTTLRDTLTEWCFGLEGGPPIQNLLSISRTTWGFADDKHEFSTRASIAEEFVQLVYKRVRRKNSLLRPWRAAETEIAIGVH
jgi:hypothetical protein